jgi:hypothetical protein
MWEVVRVRRVGWLVRMVMDGCERYCSVPVGSVGCGHTKRNGVLRDGKGNGKPALPHGHRGPHERTGDGTAVGLRRDGAHHRGAQPAHPAAMRPYGQGLDVRLRWVALQSGYGGGVNGVHVRAVLPVYGGTGTAREWGAAVRHVSEGTVSHAAELGDGMGSLSQVSDPPTGVPG